MRERPAFLHSLLPAGDTLEESHPHLKPLIGLDINQVGTRKTVLGDQDRLAVATELVEGFRGLSLQGGNELGAQAVRLEIPGRAAMRLCQTSQTAHRN